MALASGVVCTFGVELLAIVVLAILVVEVVVAPILAIIIEECMQYGSGTGRKGIYFTYVCKEFHLTNCKLEDATELVH